MVKAGRKPVIKGYYKWDEAEDIEGERDIALMLLRELFNLNEEETEAIMYSMYPMLQRCDYTDGTFYDRFDIRWADAKKLRIHKRICRPNIHNGAAGLRDYDWEELVEFATVLDVIWAWGKKLKIDMSFKHGYKAVLLAGVADNSLRLDALFPDDQFSDTLIADLYKVPSGKPVPGLPPRNVSAAITTASISTSNASTSLANAPSKATSSKETSSKDISSMEASSKDTSTDESAITNSSLGQVMEKVGAAMTARQARQATTVSQIKSQPAYPHSGSVNPNRAAQDNNGSNDDLLSREDSESDSEDEIQLPAPSRKRELREEDADEAPTAPSMPKRRRVEAVELSDDEVGEQVNDHLYLRNAPWPSDPVGPPIQRGYVPPTVFQNEPLTMAEHERYSAGLNPHYVDLKAQQLNDEKDATYTFMRPADAIFAAQSLAQELRAINPARVPTPVFRAGHPTAAEQYSLQLDGRYGVAGGYRANAGSATVQRYDSLEPERHSNEDVDSVTGLPTGGPAANTAYDAYLLPSDGLEEELGLGDLFGGEI